MTWTEQSRVCSQPALGTRAAGAEETGAAWAERMLTGAQPRYLDASNRALVRKEQKGASKRMNGKLTEGPEENKCSPGGLMHAATKATWPGDAHDQDASTGSSQVPSRNHSKNLTKNS